MTALDWWLYHRAMQEELDFVDILPAEGDPRLLRFPLNRAAQRDEVGFLQDRTVLVDTREDQEYEPATMIVMRVGQSIDDVEAAVTKTVRQVERALRELAAWSAERRRQADRRDQAMTEEETVHATVKVLLAERAKKKNGAR